MNIGKICGTGAYVPSNFMDNDGLSSIVDTSDAWIQERTGIVRRHLIKEEDTTVSMAVCAAKEALTEAAIRPEEIDLIIVSTFSSNVILPCTACEVQKELHAVNATCFDLNAACSGFLYAYNTAQAYIQSCLCKTVLLIGSESLSTLVDWTDRSTCILFGDGAGAVVMKSSTQGRFDTITCSDGEKGWALTCSPNLPIQMDGQAVFKFAVKQVPLCIMQLLEKNHLSTDEIDFFILHQANKRIVEAVAKRLQTDICKFPMNLQEYGNTSSASIPILLHELHQKKQLKRGQNIVLAGFGAGLSWGATLIEW